MKKRKTIEMQTKIVKRRLATAIIAKKTHGNSVRFLIYLFVLFITFGAAFLLLFYVFTLTVSPSGRE